MVQRGATNQSFASKQAQIVSVAVAGQYVLSVVQGKLEPQILQWLQTDGRLIIDACLDLPAPERMRSSAASVERHSIIEEGGFAGCESPSGSVCGLVDWSNPLGARREFAFARALRRVGIQWLQALEHMGVAVVLQLCKVCVGSPLEQLRSSSRSKSTQKAFSYGLIKVYKRIDHGAFTSYVGGGASLFCQAA